MCALASDFILTIAMRRHSNIFNFNIIPSFPGIPCTKYQVHQESYRAFMYYFPVSWWMVNGKYWMQFSLHFCHKKFLFMRNFAIFTPDDITALIYKFMCEEIYWCRTEILALSFFFSNTAHNTTKQINAPKWIPNETEQEPTAERIKKSNTNNNDKKLKII